MSSTMHRLTREALESVEETIRLNPPHNSDSPESIGWEALIARYPAYIDLYKGTAHVLVAEGRTFLESMDIEGENKLATIGGTIIRAHHTNEELTTLAN